MFGSGGSSSMRTSGKISGLISCLERFNDIPLGPALAHLSSVSLKICLTKFASVFSLKPSRTETSYYH